MDIVSPEKRSKIMSKIRGKNTKPELRVRKILRELGYGYRLHMKGLPGKPDVVLTKHKTVIFIHGCFWHGHNHIGMPKTNTEFWTNKIENNKKRDLNNIALLKVAGWRVIVIWKCELKNEQELYIKLSNINNTNKLSC